MGSSEKKKKHHQITPLETELDPIQNSTRILDQKKTRDFDPKVKNEKDADVAYVLISKENVKLGNGTLC